MANLIRHGEPHQIYTVMQTASEEGMLILDQSLAQLVATELISLDEAYGHVRDRNVFEQRLRMAGAGKKLVCK